MKANTEQKKAKPRKILEAEIQNKIARFLVNCGYLTIRLNSGVSNEFGRYTAFYRIVNTGSSAGIADILAMGHGCFFFVEVKTATGRMSEEQHKFSELCKKFNIDYVLARDVQTVMDYIATGDTPELPPPPKRKEFTLEQLKNKLQG